MNRFSFIAAAFAIGGLGFLGCDDRNTTTTTPQTTTPGTQPSAGNKVDNAISNAGDAIARGADRAGDAIGRGVDKTADTAREAGAQIRDTVNTNDRTGPSGEELRDVLAQIAEAALTENGLDDMVERFVDADRNRIGAGGDINGDDHNALVRQFRADWQAKYGQEFDIKDEAAVYPASSFMISTGETPRGAAGVEVDVDRRVGGGVEVEVDPRSGVDQPGSPTADTNRNDPGRNVARLSVPASHGMPALNNVSFIHEAGGWKLDASDSLTAATLRANVIQHLQKAHQMKDQWPANVNDAYAAVTHHVLMAVTGQQ